jgi:hypothetical protein
MKIPKLATESFWGISGRGGGKVADIRHLIIIIIIIKTEEHRMMSAVRQHKTICTSSKDNLSRVV